MMRLPAPPAVCLICAIPAVAACAGAVAPAGHTIAASTGRALSPAEVDDLLTRLEADMAEMTGLVASFVRERHLTQVFTEVLVSSGITLCKPPGRLRLETLEPHGSVLIAGENAVAQYEQVGQHWERVELGDDEGFRKIFAHVSGWLQGRFRDSHEVFDISAREADTLVLVLVPKADELREFIAAIELALDPDAAHIRQVTIRQADGDFRIIRFHAIRTDVALSDDLFYAGGSEPVPLPANLPAEATHAIAPR